jgi:hypothetical protein
LVNRVSAETGTRPVIRKTRAGIRKRWNIIKSHTALKDSLEASLENEGVFIEMQEKFKSEEAYAKENEILDTKKQNPGS